MRKLTHEEFVNKIKDKVGNNYTVIGQYKNANTKIRMRHNNCCCKEGYYEWDITPHGFLDGNHRCPVESNQTKVTTEIYKKKLKEINPNFELVGDYINSGTKINYRCKICNGIFDMTPDNVKHGNNCPYCSSKRVLKGFNDIWTTHPNIAKLLENRNYGYTHSFGTNEKTNFICPDCNNIIYTLPSLLLNKANEIVCPKCKDGFSYPERFVYNLLKQLNVNFKYQISSSDFKWCGIYRYDFYLTDYNYIIETHGLQHYEDTSYDTYINVHNNDLIKEHIAKENGISNYIVIDCRYSKFNYIKEKIINSDLGILFDLANFDWIQCGINATKSFVLKVCNMWNEKVTVPELAMELKIAPITVKKYLELGTELGICYFNNDKYLERLQFIKNKNISIGQPNTRAIYCHETNEVFRSISDAKKKYSLYPRKGLFGNPKRTSKGYHWSYVNQLSEDFINKHNLIINIDA